MFGDYEIKSNVSKSVHIAVLKTTSKYVAIKKISADSYDDVEFKKITKEITLEKLDLEHRNIVKIQDVFIKDFDIHVVYPFYCYGSCKEAIKNFFFCGFPEIMCALILKDLLKAIDYLHSRGIIHR